MLERLHRGTTMVFGASPNPGRYSNRAVELLVENGHNVIPLGFRKGVISGLDIELELKPFKALDTITIYMNAVRQEQYIDYLLSLNPKRMIFNPGAENPKLEALALQSGIEVLNACTLVMLRIGNYSL